MQALIEYPKYDADGQDESYLLRAQAVGVHPIFTKIMMLNKHCLSIFDKNAFLEIYCTANHDFPRQLKGSYDTRYPDLPPSRTVDIVPPYDPNTLTQFNQYPFGQQQKTMVVGESRPARQEYQYGNVNDDRDPSDDELGGGKSRRISNRKSRRKSSRKNRNFK